MSSSEVVHQQGWLTKSPPSRKIARPVRMKLLKWLSQVCGKKAVEEEAGDPEIDNGSAYYRSGEENEKPSPPTQHSAEDAIESSDDSLPTPRSTSKGPSGPYIPISECITGKPIPKSGGKSEVTYCNTSVFQFPPKVNWATHPVTGNNNTPHQSSSLSSSNSNAQSSSPVAPPRPPKPRKSGSVGGEGSTSSEPSSLRSPNHLTLEFNHSRSASGSSALSSSGQRRVGPIISPSDKSPTGMEHEYTPELKGPYLQIECPSTKDSESPKPKGGTLKRVTADSGGSVEYRQIDIVKTRALNKTIEDREKSLRNNTHPKAFNQ